MPPVKNHIAERTAVIYLLVAATWILLSDSVLALFISPEAQPNQFANIQTIKGWFFVSVTAVLLFLLLKRQLAQLERETAVRHETQQELNALLEAMPLAVVQVDPAGIVRYWNRPAEEMFGWTAEEAIGQPMPFTGPEHQTESADLRRRALSGEKLIGVEVERQTKAGNYIYINLSTSPVFDANDQPNGIIGIMADITTRKKNEAILRQLNEALEQRVAERTAELEAKNKELETFTYSVSHDLKAPLRGIDGYTRLLLEDYADKLDEEGQTFLRNVRQATGQMGQLIDDLLAYSRLERQENRRVTINLVMLIQNLLAEQRETIATRNAQINLTGVDITLESDPEGLAIILRNLLDNALKFTKEQAAPTIEVGCRQESQEYLLWVRDNGVGFEMQFRDRIFDIFQRLHRYEQYAGTGVGLAMVRKAAERMGGKAWAEGEPGVGATFYVLLPGGA